jgi:hypothetical protein
VDEDGAYGERPLVVRRVGEVAQLRGGVGQQPVREGPPRDVRRRQAVEVPGLPGADRRVVVGRPEAREPGAFGDEQGIGLW